MPKELHFKGISKTDTMAYISEYINLVGMFKLVNEGLGRLAPPFEGTTKEELEAYV